MQFLRHIVLFIALFTAFIVPAQAQFSILPYAKPDADCKILLNKYEADRKIPTVAEVIETKREEANKKSLDAKEALNNVEDALLDAKTNLDLGKRGTGEEVYALAEKVVELEKKRDEVKKAKVEAEAERDKATDEETAKRDDSSKNRESLDNLLGCAIKTGRISLAMIPYFITYITNFLLSLSGLISVLFIVIGGYQYVYSGLGEGKDKAKKTILNALIGLGVAILAWSIVNVIIGAITG